ncbi:hypothetical protein P0W64_13940 [Tsukamurella sp. 8F]|uniref:hypothetical protein n=1 Tax=unclassified Tsukamurella TaxID=2633480 RepID=UPI0023B95C84|nr:MULTISPECIES: hypothetical protein [unclassified Tsukamurella]MDF0530674.1 hypothetical protein [Tsukamurella sp. 8J]MDF0587875.1 hypothetical protein [Tsukamurella sp. 8F]
MSRPTRHAPLAGTRARLAAAVLVAVLVGIATFAATWARPSEYRGESALLARPVTQASPTGETFQGAVTLAMPALVEFAHAPSALENVRRQVTPSTSAEDLSAAITVGYDPNSAVATVSVTAQNAHLARALTSALVTEIVRADLLAPVATLAPLDTTPSVTDLRPSPAMVGALSIAAALAAAAAALVALHLWRPTPTIRLRRALGDAGLAQPVLLLEAERTGFPERVRDLARLLDRPARVVALDAGDGADGGALASSGLKVAPRSEEGAPLVLVASPELTSDELAGGLAALPTADRAAVAAVVLRRVQAS